MKKKSIAVLGSTGSIGSSALEIIKKKRNNFNIVLLLANKNYSKILKQINIFQPKIFVIINKKIFLKIKNKLKKKNIILLNNTDNIEKYIKKIDITVSAIPGIAGLENTIKFTKNSKKVLLANKESVLCGWHLIKKNAKKYKTKIIPIDSEHFSIFQLSENYNNDQIEKIYITASGGPFLNWKVNNFKKIKPKDAVKHPKWKMGAKISVDSATLMNKISELIEAIKIFPYSYEKYEIIIHPQSLIHAIIKFKNGLTKLLYHEPDMKIPIANAIFDNRINFDEIMSLKSTKKNTGIQNLDFFSVDEKKFPAIKLLNKITAHESTPIIINGANEIFVDYFLRSKINFGSIYNYLSLVLKDKNYIKYARMKCNNLKQIHIIDSWSRERAVNLISKRK